MNLGIYEKNLNSRETITNHLYYDKNGNVKDELLINAACRELYRKDDKRFKKISIITKENSETAKNLFDNADLLHISFDGYVSLKFCEDAIKNNIPYVLSIYPTDEEKLFVGEWEKNYFKLFSKYSLLTILSDVELEMNEDCPVILNSHEDNFYDQVYEEIKQR